MLVGLIVVLIVVGFISLLIYSFVRKRHGEEPVVPTSNLIRTDEVFRDPSTNRLMRVWVNPADGKRIYVAEGHLPGNI
jgi:hypothetical protein